MGIFTIGLMLTAGGLYYAYNLAPRVAQRMNAGAARSVPLGYKQYEYGFLSTMTRHEALCILGFSPTAPHPTDTELKEKYRQLMTHFHSDVRGSPLVATKINEARDLLK